MKTKVIVVILLVAVAAILTGCTAPHHATQGDRNSASGVKAFENGLRFNESDPDTIHARIYFQ